ncbi:16178_t:CDS:2, partial [Racocetra fulgida]
HIELRSRVPKLEQKLSQNDLQNTFIPKEQSLANISGMANASHRMNSDDISKPIEINSYNISDNISNPDVCHESSSQYSALPIHKESKSLENKVVNEFLGSTYKEKREETSGTRISSILVEELCSKKDSQIEMQKFIQELYLEPVSEESIEVIKNKELDISDYNENDKYIIIKLAHLYQKARKAKKNIIYAKQEVILSWYYYAEDDLAKSEASASPISPSNSTRDHIYFHNKILKQYPNLCQEGSDGNDDYYGITDKSLCSLCKLDHNDENGIEGRYEIGSYNLKCEQRGIEIEVTA